MHTVVLVLGGLATALQANPAAAQSEAVARRECLGTVRQQGVRGYALENPRFSRSSDGAALPGVLVLGASRLEFNCTIDRHGKVTDLVVTTPASR
ncbi:hypothetical protein [Roseomonas sp. HF4]|uniref:hypothetical protein n=1 Tax=Roseomonas sp. HF4 TaxID=2562313 RepID=UPI0014852786|nr:hypothetical protein [Roseomonas sp. HF4]